MKTQKVLYVRQFDIGKKVFQDTYDQVFIYPYTSKWERKWKHFWLRFYNNQWLSKCFSSVNLESYDLIIISELFSWNPIPVIQYIREKNSHCHIL